MKNSESCGYRTGLFSGTFRYSNLYVVNISSFRSKLTEINNHFKGVEWWPQQRVFAAGLLKSKVLLEQELDQMCHVFVRSFGAELGQMEVGQAAETRGAQEGTR